MLIPQGVLDAIEERRQAAVDELCDYLRLPSISTDPAYAGEVRRAAVWIQNRLQQAGLRAAIHETEGHPVVFAQGESIPGRPTLLVYGHYDVQPPDPLDEWSSPPFEPQVTAESIVARGATDNKGQHFTYLEAIRAIRAAGADLPLNVKFLVEGEEEVGSAHLEQYLEGRRQDLQADFIAISDGSKFNDRMPAITYGLRGLSYIQVEVEGPRFDLHSGGFGGMVANPVHALCTMLAQLKNPDGTVAIPGFYDRVLPAASEERRHLAALPFDADELKNYLGVDALVSEAGYTPLECKWLRPTLDVNGIWGGFSGPGAKTIIPARAGAKLSMRLVPNQRAAEINDLAIRHLHDLAPAGVKVKATAMHGSDPVLISRHRPAVQAAARAIEAGYGRQPVFTREGGSIPVVSLFQQRLGCEDILLLGWGNPDDGAHSPNERFNLDDLYRGTRSAAALMFELGSL